MKRRACGRQASRDTKYERRDTRKSREKKEHIDADSLAYQITARAIKKTGKNFESVYGEKHELVRKAVAHLEKGEIDKWNERKKRFDGLEMKINFDGVNILSGPSFKGANLDNMSFVGAVFSWKPYFGSFGDGPMVYARDLSETSCRRTIFQGAVLEEVSFRNADVEDAIFNGARLRKADFLNARNIAEEILAHLTPAYYRSSSWDKF